MQIPKEIIEKAISGGWKPKVGLLHQTNKIAGCFVSTCDNVPALDPTFWQALGKALAWDKNYSTDYWQGQAHNFYQLILEGQDTGEFWKELTH